MIEEAKFKVQSQKKYLFFKSFLTDFWYCIFKIETKLLASLTVDYALIELNEESSTLVAEIRRLADYALALVAYWRISYL